MTAIASCRPMADCAPEIAANQLTAQQSWRPVFEDIVLFNEQEPGLASGQTTFIPSENWPKIKELVHFASLLPDWSCIINADIVVSLDFLHVEHSLRKIGANCATSSRYEFEPLNPVVPKRVMDLGLDIFCATPEVWKAMLPLVPDAFRIGHTQWDSFTLGFLNDNFGGRFFDFTPAEVIYHPKHGNRKTAHEVPAGLTPFSNFAMPFKKII